jgi:DNA-binding winged helix-turn-helix (wHTH) protein
MSVCHFGAFEFDPQTGDLRRAGEDPTVLPPQLAKLLQVLTERANDLVTRDDIATALWPTDPPADIRLAINRAVGELRERLGDNAQDPVYIQTIPQRGFRFIMRVEWVNRRPPDTINVKRKRSVVGRDSEKQQLRDALDSVSTGGRGLLVSVKGDSGLGKTTLVDDFISDLLVAGAACRIARGRCSEQLEGGEGYVPFLEALQDVIDDSSPRTADLIRTIAPTWYFKIKPPSVDDPAPSRRSS